ncbi:MAG: MFS transporter [Anaerolineales bacterium]|nr:MFS transporter [Anaerolineales bacterium]
MERNKLITIFAIVFVDLLGFSILIPLIPFYAKLFAASDTVVGLLVASYAAAQFVGAPILGRWSDVYGRRPILLISILGTVAGFIILGVANSLWLLFASRVLDGLTGGNISVAQAYITDVTDEQNRARGLGMIGAAFGLGFIIGPALGGLLSAWGATFAGGLNWEFALPAFVAASLAAFNWLGVFLWLPESLTAEERAANRQRGGAKRGFSFRTLREALQRPFIGSLLTVRFFYSLAFGLFQTIFPLYALNRLGLEAAQTAYVLTYVGVLVVLVQGVFIGRLTARYDERRLLFYSTVLMTISLLGWAFAPSLLVLLVVLIPLALAGGIFNTVINSALTKAVTREEVGGMLGLSAALESLTRVIAPSSGGVLIQLLGTAAPGVVGAIITAVLIPYTWRTLMPRIAA